MSRVFLVILFVVSLAVILNAQNIADIFVSDGKIICSKAEGDIVFYLDDIEQLRISETGAFLVGGRVITTDMEIYEGFREWLVENRGHLRRVK